MLFRSCDHLGHANELSRSELSISVIAEAFERVDRIPDDRFPDRATDAATTRLYFTTWARELLDDH